MARFNTQSITTSVTGAGTVASPQAFTALNGTAPYTVVLPSPVLFPGSSQTFYNATSGVVTLSTPSGLFGGLGASGAGTLAIPTNSVVSVTSDGVNYIVLSEDGSALVATTGSFSSNVTANGAAATVSLTPQTVTIAPTGASTIDNINIGTNTRGSGAFNTLTANSAVTFTANTTSSSTGTGSLVVTGGVGVSGAVYAAGLYGPLTGTIQTAAQTNITSVGTLTGLTVSGNSVLGSAGGTVTVNTNGAESGKLAVLGATTSLVGTDVTGNTAATFAGYQPGTTGNNFGMGILLKPIYGRGTAVWLGALNDGTNQEGTGHFVIRSGNYATNTTEKMRITSAGNVGIGTATPNALFHVYNTGGATNSVNTALIVGYDSTAATTTGGGTAIELRGSSSGGNIANYSQARIRSTSQPTNNAHGLAFDYKPNAGTALTEGMRIDVNGYVGIGTDAPGAHLEISAGAPQFILNANSQSTNFKKIRLASSNNTAGDFVISAVNDDNSFKNYMFYASNAGNIGLSSPGYTNSSPGTYGKLDIYQATDPGITPAALSVRLQGVGGGSGAQYGINVDASQSYNGATALYGIRVVASQNVGQTTYGVHSTVNPGNSNTARFGVYGKTGFNSDAIHGLTNSTLPVGVYGEAINASGTTNISTSAAGYFLNSSTLGAVSLGVYIKTTAGPTSIVPLRIDHAAIELLRVDSAGRMGIGTDAPGTGYAGAISDVKLALRGGVVGQNGGSSTLLIGGDNNHYAAITGTHVSGGMTYLAFSTSLTTSNPTERMRILSNGKINRGGVSDFYTAGNTVGTTSFFIDVPVENDDGGTANTYHIQASFSHANWGAYGCLLEVWANYRGAGGFAEQYETRRVNSGNGGSWTVSKPNINSIRITKNAGTYAGGGPYWIRVTMSA